MDLLSKRLEKNKYGGYTWVIRLDLFHIFVHETDNLSFVVECKEWKWVSYKTHFSFVSNSNIEETIVNALERSSNLLIQKGYVWTSLQKNSVQNQVLNLLRIHKGTNAKPKTIMRDKYHSLIQDLLSPNPSCKIHQESSDSITLGLVSNMGAGSTLFVLTQTFERLTVQWLLDSPFYGKHKLEWSFQECENQKEMLECINNDVTKYLKNIIP